MFDWLQVRHVMTIASFFVLTVVVSAAWGEVAVVDGTGQITALTVEGQTLDVQVSYRIPLKGWGKLLGPWDAKGVKVTWEAQRMSLIGRVEVEPGKSYAVEQTIDDRDDAVTLTLTFTAEAEVETEGVFLWIDVPIDRFAGGACGLRRGDRIAIGSDFPREKPADRHFLRGNANSITMSSPKQDAGLDIAWARTEMTPYEWEPENDNDSPGDTDCGYLGKHDRPGSNLRREFLLAKQIQDMGVPYAISIWALPKWLYEHTYALPAANDPEALRYCGAIGFHSWGGAKPGQYAAWGDLAERLKLPLLHAHFARGVVVRIECVCSPSAGI